MFESEHRTLNRVAPGKHILELHVVAADYQTELDARYRTELTVREVKEERK